MQQWYFHFLLLAVSCSPAFADIDFFGYQRSVTPTYNTQSEEWDTSVTYIQRPLGSVQLEISEISVTPKGSYLDIVEDAWLSGNLTELNMKDMTENYLIKGTIPIPYKAAVTGLLTWKSDTCFKAELQPSRYNFDMSYTDSLTLMRSLDSKVALLQQQSETVYEATFSRVALGERKHVRVRYLLPNTGSGIGVYEIPVLFHSSKSKAPRFIQLTVNANATSLAYNVVTANGEMPIRDIATISIPYQRNFVLKYAGSTSSSMHLTSFSGGPFTGNYALINTEINDSLLGKLSRPIQTVFIWRWNGTQNFIDYSNKMKGLSVAAMRVIEQAGQMKSAMKSLLARGYRCALIHCLEGEAAPLFQSKEINDSSTILAMNYLSNFDEHTLFSKYSNQPDPLPSWVPQEVADESFIDKVRKEFLTTVGLARNLMTDPGCYHHIILPSSGDVAPSFSKDLHDTLAAILDSGTIDMTSAQWRGVNISASLPSGMQRKLVSYMGFNWPMFFPATVQLRVDNGSRPFLFPISGEHSGVFAVSIRMQTPWDTMFNWTGFASNGEKTANFSMRPYLFQTSIDSGLVKIWAKDENHFTDKEEIHPAGTFGIVTKEAFLQATVKNINPDIAMSVPFLNDNEIHAPRTSIANPRKLHPGQEMSVTLARGGITVFSFFPAVKIELFDVRGRRLASVNPSQWATGKNHYFIPIHRILNVKGLKTLFVKISGNSQSKTFKLNLEGLR
jgi:hypothetical protein